MTTTDEHVRGTLRGAAEEIEAEVDTETALANVLRGNRRVPTALWLGVAAAAVAAGAIAVLAARNTGHEVVVSDRKPTLGATAAPTTVPPTTVGGKLPATTVEFTGIGALRLGMTLSELPGWTTRFDLGPACGVVSLRDDTWDLLWGRVVDVQRNGVHRVDAVYTTDPRFRTVEGMGVGSTIDELRATFGASLREAELTTDPGGQQAEGRPHAWYSPVAAIFDGDYAITFVLSGSAAEPVPGHVVSTVKVSDASFSGDDEGCA